MSALLKELTLSNGLKLKNRVALAPLTRGRCGVTNVPNDAVAEYYAQRAEAGLLITEATHICKAGDGWAGAAAIYNSDHVDGWKKVTKKVHEAGGVIFCQFWHMGRTTHSVFHGMQPVAPSAIPAEGQVTDYKLQEHKYEVPRAMSKEDIKETLGYYKQAAVYAKEAGFDGVEVHSANGYLLDEFLQTCSNQRDDEYGGSLENRFRFLSEAIATVQEVFPTSTGVRLSPNGAFNSMGSPDNHEAFTQYIKWLDSKNLVYLHLMDGLAFGFHNVSPQFSLSDAKKVYNGTIIGNCGYTQETAEEAVSSGNAEMIAFGRPFIANPDLVNRFRNKYPLAEGSHETYWTYPGFPEGDPRVGYTDYPVYSA